jgi:hypothetical protein
MKTSKKIVTPFLLLGVILGYVLFSFNLSANFQNRILKLQPYVVSIMTRTSVTAYGALVLVLVQVLLLM